ncbi:MAG: hypothetical protein ACJAVP_003574 [Spirosomataceae bacterium]|jgi:hypothetical protein
MRNLVINSQPAGLVCGELRKCNNLQPKGRPRYNQFTTYQVMQ